MPDFFNCDSYGFNPCADLEFRTPAIDQAHNYDLQQTMACTVFMTLKYTFSRGLFCKSCRG